jgi:hypothetical protein
MDPDPGWKDMKKVGGQLFRELGELRDAQVMEEWVRSLGNPDDPVAIALLQFLAGREAYLKQQAARALQDFDRKQWKRWIVSLPRRAARMRTGSALFKHLALERWTEAYPYRISPPAYRVEALPLHRGKLPAGATCRVERRS